MCRKILCLVSFVLVLGLTGNLSAQLPAGWSQADIATPGGSATESAGTWTLKDNGLDIWGTTDGFEFAYQKLTGGCVITARVATIGPGTSTWAKAGVMVRETLDPGSKHAMMVITSLDGAGKAFQLRPDTGGSSYSSHSAGSQVQAPFWVRLVRNLDTFTGYYSADGVNWVQQPSAPSGNTDPTTNPRDITMAKTVYVGLCLTSHADTVLGEMRTATFDNVSIVNTIYPYAWGPDPADGKTGVTIGLVSWKAGETAAFHDVYFGTNPTPGPAEYKGRQGYLVYWFGILTPGATYYWRIDEVEADGTTIHTGNVWSFMAQPLTAWNPKPANGATNVLPAVQLSWGAGAGATKHHVYFGDSFTDVDSGTGGTDKGDLALAVTTYNAGPLYPETTYYWRVDEYDGTTTTWRKGDIWSFATSAGGSGVMREWWLNIGAGTTIPDLTGNVNYPDNPTGRETLDIFEGPVDWADNYGSRLYGWLMPPESGDYTFWIASDDPGQLWLSTDADPANKQMIASVPGWTPSRDFDNTGGGTGGASQKSLAISLVKGKAYYIEALMKEGGGGDNIAVAWQGGAITSRQVISGGYVSLAPFAPIKAFGPIPADKATDVSDTVTLRWSAGQKAATHNVYFGTDATAVANATTASTGIYRGQQNLAAVSYAPTEAPLQWNKTYYWRIDEVNPAEPDGPWKGIVWSFTTANYIVVDDFESYTDNVGSRIFQTWKDGWGYNEPAPGYPGNGTGSAVGYSQPPFAELTTVHGGGQSMPLGYDNTGTTGKTRYSETFREWTSPQNWTRNNVKALTLYVRGIPLDFLESPAGTFTMSAEGSDIWAGTDEFRYVYKQLSGDGEIIARVVRIAGPATNEWRKGGVMIRETLDPTSKHAFMAVSPNPTHGLAFQYRDGIDAADSDSEHGVDNQTAPYWVKVVRKGNVFTGYHSPDGITWTMKDPSGTETDASNPVTITMASNVYIGLALTSHENDVLCMAQFSNVSTGGSVTGAWTVVDIASTVTGTNDDEPLYVAVEDSSGKIKVVTNDNPLAAVDPDWPEWNIELTQFSAAGVNLAAVKKMYIGLGSRSSPKVGGTGTIYVDDIRVYPSRCVPSMGKPAADLSGNCVVDYLDLDIMAQQWLQAIPPATALSADLNADKKVDLKDYAKLADVWLEEILWP
jgi:hypothetical protein